MDSGRPPLEAAQIVDYEKRARQVLADNVERLKTRKNLSQNALARLCGWQSSTNLDRIKKLKDSGINLITSVAIALGVQPWQLLVPDFDPDNPPEILSPADREALEFDRRRRAR